MKKTISTNHVTYEMERLAVEFADYARGEVLGSVYVDQFCKAILEASPEVKAEPVAFGLPNPSITDKNKLLMVAIDIPSDDQYGGALWLPLYLHPPAESDLVERIRALEIAEPMGWMDRCHNGVVAKIIELIEGAK